MEENYWVGLSDYAIAYNIIQPLSERFQKMLNWHVEQTPINSQKIIDNGCGPGFLSSELLKMGKTLIANDVNSDFLKIFLTNCKGYENNFKLIESSGEKLREHIQTNSVDVVHSTLVLPFPEDIKKYVQTSYELLREGGKFVMTSWANVLDPYHGAITLLKEELLEKGIFESLKIHWDSVDSAGTLDTLTSFIHERNLTSKKLESILSECNFRDVKKFDSPYGEYAYSYTCRK